MTNQTTEQETVNTTSEICGLCGDTGVYPAPNGEDDSELVFCSCDIGRKAEEANV